MIYAGGKICIDYASKASTGRQLYAWEVPPGCVLIKAIVDRRMSYKTIRTQNRHMLDKILY